MLKYTTIQVTFREIPDEITLCINISGCPIKCPDCHSKELWADVGTELSTAELKRLISQNKGITCVCFMGGDNREDELYNLIYFIHVNWPSLYIAWYTGQTKENCKYFSFLLDYIKYGPYVKELGGLDNPNTNQRLYKIFIGEDGNKKLEDITYKFWKSKQLCQEQKIG